MLLPPLKAPSRCAMNRYEWNRFLIEPFTRMSLWGIRSL